MNILILKLGAAGDVLRTTPLLSLFPDDHVTWVTSDQNRDLLTLSESLAPVTWTNCGLVHPHKFDLAINLEDSEGVGFFLRSQVNCSQIFGAYMGKNGVGMQYTEDSSPWFDMGLISKYGLKEANRLKWLNRRSYQEIIFSCLGHKFSGQPYLMPKVPDSNVSGDIAVCPSAGKTWPMKNWGRFQEAISRMQEIGYSVTILPQRTGILEHLADVRAFQCLLSADSLPMHAAIGYGVPSVTVFTCTSPWEIYDYGLQKKIVSPRLEQFFYSRSNYVEYPDVIDIDMVVSSVLESIPTPQHQ